MDQSTLIIALISYILGLLTALRAQRG